MDSAPTAGAERVALPPNRDRLHLEGEGGRHVRPPEQGEGFLAEERQGRGHAVRGRGHGRSRV